MGIKFRRPLGEGMKANLVEYKNKVNDELESNDINKDQLLIEENDTYIGDEIYSSFNENIEERKFYNNENGVFIKKNNEKISRNMYIDSISINRDDNTNKATIKFKALRGDSQIIVSRDYYLNKKKLMEFQKVGLDITHKNNSSIVEYLRECEDNTIVKYTHSKLGFTEYSNKKVYNLYRSTDRQSIYEGKYRIKPTGSREEYINMVKEQVLGNANLEFMLIAGVSSVMLGYLGEELGLSSSIIHLVGNSTTGKSTALKLAISCFGYPDTKYDGLYGTYNGTNNALLKKIGGLQGVPYALDEISMSDTENFTKFIYGLANGTDKERLNSDSELKEKDTWLTCILSNGEKSILRASNKNAGLQIRVIEIENINWTKSAENAEIINSIIQSNYGFLGIEFATYILRKDKNSLIEQYREVRDDLYNNFKSKNIIDSMTQRRCNTFAIIIQTALLMQNMLKVEFDIEGITNILVKAEESSLNQRNFKRTIIEFITQYVEKNINKFIDGSNKVVYDVLGSIKDKGDYLEVQMDKISFNKIINEGGYEDEKIALKELKQAGYLDYDKGRYTRKRKNTLGCRTEVVVIKIYK